MTIENMIDLYEATTGASVINSHDGLVTITDWITIECIDEEDLQNWLEYQLKCEVEVDDFIAVDDITGERLTADFISCNSAIMTAFDEDRHTAYIGFTF